MIERQDRDRITRRRFVAGASLAAAAGPFVWTRRAGAAGKVIIRTIGGSYEEATVKAIFEPFTKATSIEVVKVPATLGKVLAMHEAGNMELDVMDAGELGVFSLSQKGALDKINYKAWKLTNPDDIDPAVRRDDMVADIFFSSVLGYNNQTFPTGKQPRNWAEFWDLKKFTGPRMLAEEFRNLPVLVVDDLPSARLALGTMLETLSCRVTTAGSGASPTGPSSRPSSISLSRSTGWCVSRR